jgi:hypothetical protein
MLLKELTWNGLLIWPPHWTAVQRRISEYRGKISKMVKPFGERDISYVSYLSIKEKRINNYDYLIIKGSVRNNGVSNITQCLIKVKIYDQNNDVISTNESYIFGDIVPGEAKNFRSITAWPNSAKTYKLNIEELTVKQ